MCVANKKRRCIEWKSTDKLLVETMSKEEMKEQTTMRLEKRFYNLNKHKQILTYTYLQVYTYTQMKQILTFFSTSINFEALCFSNTSIMTLLYESLEIYNIIYKPIYKYIYLDIDAHRAIYIYMYVGSNG